MITENKYHFAREIIVQLRSTHAINEKVYLHWLDKLLKEEAAVFRQSSVGGECPKEITHEKMDNSEWIVAYTTFLKESVKELLKAEKSIIKDGYVKITEDEEYKCSDTDLAKYKIEYKYPLHLIHLGQDLHRAELKLSEELKRKWYAR